MTVLHRNSDHGSVNNYNKLAINMELVIWLLQCKSSHEKRRTGTFDPKVVLYCLQDLGPKI